MSETHEFNWQRYPAAETFIAERADEVLAAMPTVRAFSGALFNQTGSRLIDWIDHLVLIDGDLPRRQLAELGFEPEDVPAEPGDIVYYHPGAIFPRVLLRNAEGRKPGATIAAAIQVEDINLFLMANQLSAGIEGTLLSPLRRATVWQRGDLRFLAVERRGHAGFVPTNMPPDYPARYLQTFERWATRARRFDDVQTGMSQTLDLARTLVSDMGTHTAAWIAFSAERAHWQQRNRAGQVQKACQDRLGLGWANHDHHTFRSSRRVFPTLIKILETFGFRARERFYAGAEAGWGAQVMEQPVCRFAVFADVDLRPAEVEGDFAHNPLPALRELGTVGLWCALHGEAMLSAGLHHLAALFDFDAAAG
ncbi:MAG: hypothetical protein GWN58_12405, partial [Anaerolineae bacterium]|nr:hypothetical protein [Anaerolineae bacterium]